MGRQHQIQDEPDRTIPEDTIVRAKLAEIQYNTVRTKDGDTEKATFIFQVTAEGLYKGRKVRGEAWSRNGHFLSNHPGNKFRLWASALLNRELKAGEPFEDDDILGLSADITVRHDDDRKDPDKKWERVDDVLPLDAGFALSDEPPF